jgi:hypothetical protein
LLFTALKIAAFVAAASQPPLEVKLSRPFVAGQVFSYAAVARSYRQTIVSTEGAVVQQSVRGLRSEIAAALQIEEVSEAGRARVISLRLFRFGVREGFKGAPEEGDGKVLLKPGTTLRAVYPEAGGGAPQISAADGKELAAEVIEALRLVLPAPAGGRDDDALFGRSEPARFGDSWVVDAEATLEALREGGLEVDPAQFEGEATLSAIDFEGGYEVEVELRGGRAGVILPEGYVTRSGELSSRLRLRFGADPDSAPLSEETEYSLRSHALGREGERLMMVDMVFFQSRRSRYQPVGG